MKDIGHIRKSYEKKKLSISEVSDNPLQQFRTWFYEVLDDENSDEVNAMSVSTISLDGYPKTRIVLLKKYDEHGFYFYTNYQSDKGKALLANPKVCLSFFWANMERQVLIKGLAEKTSEADSLNYFASRPRGSQLGALVSQQSEVIDNRQELDQKLKDLEKKHQGKEIPKPKHWGGILVRPVSIEFWQGQPNRLHDRIQYTLQEDYNWKLERLAP